MNLALPTVRQETAPPVSIFEPDTLARMESYQGYRSATPYPHAIFDDLFDPEALRTILREWPNDNLEQHNDGTFVQKKQGTTWKTQFGPYTSRYFADLASPQLLVALEKLTGMWGLIPDPYLFGGGLHATAAGGKLAVHADFNKHFRFKLDRRLNMLVYLNEGWTEENSGWLELWDQQMQTCVQRVLPVFNRTVIFSTTRTSYHGQPEAIVGPPDLRRRSIALYFYSNGRADEGAPPDVSGQHTTLWQERPGRGY
jgi:hypothetical protein